MSEGHPLLKSLSAERQMLVRHCAEAAIARDEAVYLVGGPVRDLLLGRPVEDIDVVVVGDGLAVAQHVSRATGGRLTRYHAFGTARIDLVDGHRIDVATARAESYQHPGVLPEVRPGSLSEDLDRRDFTINAMAIGLGGRADATLVDPLGGRRDLEAGLVRFLHEGSFIDDPSRMLRALRFALRFGYGLEEGTARALEAGARGAYLDSISGDRLRRELAKLLQEQPVDGPARLQATGLLPTIDGALCFLEPVLRALVRELDRLAARRPSVADSPLWTLVLAALMTEVDVQSRWRLVRRLRLSRQEREPLVDGGAPWGRALAVLRRDESRRSAVAESFDALSEPAIVLGAATLRAAGDVAIAERVEAYLLEDRDCRARLEPAKLGELGCPSGPRLGEMLRVLRAARLDGLTADAEQEMELARGWLRERQIDPPEGP